MTKYRSKFEQNVAAVLDSTWAYESLRVPYTVYRKYTPDFVSADEQILIEVKGYFRAGDVSKYKAIKEANPNKRLIFVFSNPLKKVRKGAKLSMGAWADKNGWEYTTLRELATYWGDAVSKEELSR